MTDDATVRASDSEPEAQVIRVSESALVATDDAQLIDRDRRRKAAILRAVGLDKVPEEQRELAIAIARRYDLDLMLKHLVLIDGRPFITRDALLWIAHRSGQFDGMQLIVAPEIREFPELGKCWYSETTVWRKDMSHGFTLPGRYPVGGRNKTYGPEMSIKVSESMSLRRAFNVSASTVEEQWDSGNDVEPQPVQTLAEKVAARATQIETGQTTAQPAGQIVVNADEPLENGAPEPEQADADLEALVEREDAESVSMGLVDES